MEQRVSPRYSIREVSQTTGVPPHTLRFWEKSLAPLLRPFRTPGGQRRYDDGHVALIREVHRRLSHERQSLAGVRHDLLRRQAADPDAGDLGRRLLADPVVQQALDDVAAAVTQRVLHLLDQPAPPAPAPPEPAPQGAAS